METDILKTFNLSYSTYSVYEQSQLQFYFQKIVKAKPTDEVYQVYGDAGNVVHKSVEDSSLVDEIKSKFLIFSYYWDYYKIDNQTGFNGTRLNFEDYSLMFNKALKFFINNIDNNEFIIEKEFLFDFHGIKVKAFIDLIEKPHSGIPILKDWKTNSKHSHAMHKTQRLFYSWVYWKVNNIIPKCEWVYLKHDKIHSDEFSIKELQEFEQKIIKFIDEIKEKGNDISKYEAGNWKGPFNSYRTLCAEEADKRLLAPQDDKINITMEIKGFYIFIKGATQKLLDGIDYELKFNLSDKYFLQERAKQNATGVIDLSEIGVYHLFNRKLKCFPIGLLKKVEKIIHDYSDHYKIKQTNYQVNDNRDQGLLDYKIETSDQLCTTKTLRDYQKQAVIDFITEKTGIIQIATGGGKTLVAAEIIRRCQGRTLWIIDRKELLEQTRTVLCNLFDTQVGVISGQTMLFGNITIATVQSLVAKIADQRLQDYLYLVNFVCVDEFHKAAAESYLKVFAKLPNTKYRLGLTATPFRGDGKTPILNAILGKIVHVTDSQYLISNGHLVLPEINFIKMSTFYSGKIKKYDQDYLFNIVKNDARNNKICEIITNNPEKKTLILVKSVDHGKYLMNICGKVTAFIHGSMEKMKRTSSFENFRNSPNAVLIMTSSIGSEGLDIPDLDIIINASANKGNTKTLQMLGRVLRTFKGKNTAKYYDFVDCGKWTSEHSNERMKVLKRKGYVVNVLTDSN